MRLTASFLLLALLSCSEGGPAATTVFSLPRDGAESAFFDLPWPTDMRVDDAGFVDLSEFPNPNSVPLLDRYIDASVGLLDGYGMSATGYSRFETAIDESTLPAGELASVSPEASAFLMNVDPESDARGERHPSVAHFWDPETEHWPGHTLAIRPTHGVPLRAGTTYAMVVTDRVTDAFGEPFARPRDLDIVLGLRPPQDAVETAAVELHRDAVQALEDAGVAVESIINLSVFTTHDSTSELMRARDFVRALPTPTPIASATALAATEPGYLLLHGAYESPIFQQGDVPYTMEGGDIRFDEAGDPIQVGSFDARYALAVPTSEMPESGWPLVLYAHGTSGDFETFVRNGVADDLTSRGYAVMGTDQIHHGPRNPSRDGAESLVFNFANPRAFRDNNRQSALDLVMMARFARENPVNPRVVGEGVFIDNERVWFYGHSQGGLNGPLFLSIDDQANGGVLSGSGSHIGIALVDKIEPVNIPSLVGFVLRWPGPIEERNTLEHFVYEHPVLALLQTYVDVGDPGNYVHRMFAEPPPGFAPKSVLQTEGTNDLFTPPRAIEAIAVSMRAPVVGEVLVLPAGSEVLGLTPEPGPLQGNVAGGAATAGLVQEEGGHFVAFSDPVESVVNRFFESALVDNPPVITP